MTLFGTIHVTWSEMLWMKSLWYAALLLQVRMVVCLNPNAEEFDESVVSKLIQFVKVAYKKSCICSQTLICLPPSSSFVCLSPHHLFTSLLVICLPPSSSFVCLPPRHLFTSLLVICLPPSSFVCLPPCHLFTSLLVICLPPSSSFVCLPPRHLFASLLSMSWSLQNSLRMLLLPDQNLSSEFQISCKEKFMSFRGPFGWFRCGQMLRLAQVFAAFCFAVVCILVHPLFFDSSRFDTGLTPGRRRGKL